MSTLKNIFNKESLIPDIAHAPDIAAEAQNVKSVLENKFGETPVTNFDNDFKIT